MVLKFYFDYNSQPCRALAIFCRIHGIQFEEEIVSFVTGQTRSEEFAKINPVKKVPVMDDDGWILTESIAIIRYLCASRNISGNWYPTDLKKRARVDEFLAWQHTGVRIRGAMVFIALVFDPKRNDGVVDKKSLKERCETFEQILNQMENYYLKDRDYVGGSELSIADLFGICELQQPVSVGYDVTRDRPRLAAWIQRVKEAIQPHFDETHKNIFELGGKYAADIDALIK